MRRPGEKLKPTTRPESRVVTWPVKLSTEEALALEPKILAHARGNRSLYIRAALAAYKPNKKDFE